MGIYTFKGQVKVADVQAAFDNLLGRINSIIDTYNAADNITTDLDLSIGGTTLAPYGYTLTIGGLKQLMAAYDGTLLGSRAFRIDNTHVVITDGVLFTTDKIVRINTQVLEGDGVDLYYDPSDDSIGLVEAGTYPAGTRLIMQLALGGEYLTTFRDVQLEKMPGYSFSIQKRGVSENWDGDNTSIMRFQGAGTKHWNGIWGNIQMFDNGDIVSQAWGYDGHAHRRHFSVTPANFLFIPKGCNSPIKHEGSGCTRTQYTVTFNKPTSS